ncbi:hypothetical protein DCAR_0103336 [Daucus carota subsp. sativus]|uniref:Uncharacterized protein n=1 Tax=Daucus carota subsp. sativus TaxID=79200 RepID=A0AAF0W6J9_DAUCS|nr:hypothetical protein DCAR_0103336 [Daucus carota subsp. sativus]
MYVTRKLIFAFVFFNICNDLIHLYSWPHNYSYKIYRLLTDPFLN